MIKKLNKAGVGLFIAALSVAALAVQDGVTLKRAPKVGDTIKFRLKGSIDFGGTQMPMTMLVTEKVSKVDDNGNFTIESTQSEGTVTTDSGEQDIPGDTVDTIFKPTGEVVAVKTDASKLSFATRLANLQALVVPDRPLKVGDEWTFDFKKDDKSGAVAAKGTYKVDGQEKIGDFDCYRIKTSVKETGGGDSPASAEGTTWVNIKDGTTVKAEGAWTNAPFPDAPFPINAKFSLSREG